MDETARDIEDLTRQGESALAELAAMADGQIETTYEGTERARARLRWAAEDLAGIAEFPYRARLMREVKDRIET